MTPCLSGRVAARGLRAKFDRILPHFDERRRRLYLASEATAIGRGGIARVAEASGTSTATIARGVAELAGGPSPTRRIRAPGAGRKRLTDTDSGLLPTLESLIEPHTRGDPVSPLRWTTLSLRALASTLTARATLSVLQPSDTYCTPWATACREPRRRRRASAIRTAMPSSPT